MLRPELDPHLHKIALLAEMMNKYAPASETQMNSFRSELAGLLVVATIASYETCVKETIFSYAARQHPKFSEYAERKYEKLSSNIALNNLKNYADMFDPNIKVKFDLIYKKRKDKINKLLGQNIEKKYEQLLRWRNAYAHAGKQDTTIEEVLQFHRYSKHIIFSFYDAFQE